MKSAKMISTIVLLAALAAFGEDYDPAKHGNPIRVLTGAVEIDGHGVTIDAKGAGRCATLGPDVTLKNFTFSRGKAEIAGGVYGGRIENCTVTGCSASESGAALVNCTAVDCLIAGNAFANGSSVAAAHGGLFFGSTLTRCTVRDNAIAFGSDAPAFGAIGEQVTVTDCTVADNAIRCEARTCYGTLYADSTIDGVKVEFLDGETKGGGEEEEEKEPQPDPGSYTPETDPALAIGEGMVDRYYKPAYLDELDASGDIARLYDRKTTVKVEGLPKGLKLVKESVSAGYRYWIEGVPTETMDGETRLAYVRVTDSAKNVTFRPLANLRVASAAVAVFPAGTNKVEYWRFPVSKIWPDYAGNETSWTFSGWPSGLKFASRATTYKSTAVAAGRVYGTPTKVDVYTVKAVEKIAGTSYKSTHRATFGIRYPDGEPPEEEEPKPTPGFLLKVGGLSETIASVKDIRVGVGYAWAITNTVGSTVSQSGLPTGLRLSSVRDRATGRVTYSVTGVPTKAGYCVATFTTKLNGVSAIQTTAFNVIGLPSWAQGTFDGGTDETFAEDGQVTLTVSKTGKVSGKWLSRGTNWTLTASSYARFENEDYLAEVVFKTGSGRTLRTLTNELAVAEDAELDAGFATNAHFLAYQNNWKYEPWKSLGKSIAKAPAVVFAPKGFGADDTVSLKVAASGKVTVKGKIGGYGASGTAVLCPQTLPDGTGAFTGVVFAYLPPKAKTPLADGLYECVFLHWNGTQLERVEE